MMDLVHDAPQHRGTVSPLVAVQRCKFSVAVQRYKFIRRKSCTNAPDPKNFELSLQDQRKIHSDMQSRDETIYYL